jgi:hypothetical protein
MPLPFMSVTSDPVTVSAPSDRGLTFGQGSGDHSYLYEGDGLITGWHSHSERTLRRLLSDTLGMSWRSHLLQARML